MTLTQARNASDAPDWHPDGHPPMPDVVRHGRDSRRCTRVRILPLPERARPARKTRASPGCLIDYFIQQVNDFKHGLRKTSELRRCVRRS